MTKIFIKFRVVKLLTLVCSSFFLASCGGGSSEGAGSAAPSKYKGVAQKGPFQANSSITVSRIDSSGKLTEKVLTGSVLDNKGNYQIDVPTDWGNLNSDMHLTVKGKFFQETDGLLSKHSIELSSITSDNSKLSINVLTDWATRRIKVLLSEGKKLADARQQANTELDKIFGIDQINQLDIARIDKLQANNSQLLLLSGALLEVASKRGVSPQLIINEFGNDFSDNGLLDDLGDDWFLRMQAAIRDNPAAHVRKYLLALKDQLNIESPDGELLPKVVNLAMRPVAVLPEEIFAEPGETIVLDGSESFAVNGIDNFTWFRVDQQAYEIPFLKDGVLDANARFLPDPSITVPNEESILLFALVVTDKSEPDELTHTKVVKVIIKEPEPDNNPPVVSDQFFEIDEDESIAISLTGEDPDGDSVGYNFNTPVSLPNGILNGTPPNITYSPDENFNGTEIFKYIVNDGQEDSLEATVTIVVNPVNDPPEVQGQNLAVAQGQELPINLLGTDVDGDALTYEHDDQNLDSESTLTGSGQSLIYTSGTSFIGTDSFTFVVNDGTVDSTTATINISVSAVAIDNPPVAISQMDTQKVITDEDEAVDITLVGNDDIDSSADLDYEILYPGPIFGTLSVVNGQMVVYTPDENSNSDNQGTNDSFTFTVTDSNGSISNEATVEIQVNSINDGPESFDITCTLNPNTSLNSIDLNFNNILFVDPEGDSVTTFIINNGPLPVSPISLSTSPLFMSNGELIADLSSANTSDEVTFEYIVADEHGSESEPATVKVQMP